jgi:hypothetical protein
LEIFERLYRKMKIANQNQSLTSLLSLILDIDIGFEVCAGTGSDSVRGLRYCCSHGAVMQDLIGNFLETVQKKYANCKTESLTYLAVIVATYYSCEL